MKFAHLADCHIASWREPKLKELSMQAFTRAISICIEKQVDFVLIAGDLFDTPLPPVDYLKTTVSQLKKLKDNNIPLYIIPGSHDFSVSGKTFLDVLSEADLAKNVVKGEEIDGKLKLKFTIDPKTNIKITGLLGKKGLLDKEFYKDLDRSIEQEPGYKIFMFHTAITEFKSEEMEKIDSIPLSFLPKNFDYYAGGHVHEQLNKPYSKGKITMPGALFPCNFREIEKLQGGGFFIVEDNIITFEPIHIINVFSIIIDCTNKTPEIVEQEILSQIKNKEFNNTIVTIRLKGKFNSHISDINFKDIFHLIYEKSAYFVMKSTSLIKTDDFEEVKFNIKSVDDLEDSLIQEHLGQSELLDKTPEQIKQFTKDLLKILSTQKQEGEKTADFERRIQQELLQQLNL